MIGQNVNTISDDIESSAWLPWIVSLSAALFFFYEFIQGNMFASIADNLMRDFHIQMNRMAYLSSMYYISNVLFLFIAGQLLDRYSPKRILLFAMVLCIFSTFMLAASHTFHVALISRFLTGVGSAFCLAAPVRIASKWFPPQRMALITGLIVTVAMLGGMMAQYPMTLLVSYVGWRDAVRVVGWVGVVLWGIMSIGVIEKPQDFPMRALRFWDVFKRSYTHWRTIRVGLFAMLMNMPIALLGAMIGSLYLMQRLGISKEQASSINGMLFLGTILGGPLMGRWSDYMGVRLLPMRVGAILSLAAMLIVLYCPCTPVMMYFLFFIIGFFTAAQVISYPYVAECHPHHMIASSISLVSISTQVGYVLFQNGFSYLLMHHGQGQMGGDGILQYTLSDYQFAATILPIGLFVAYMLMFKLQETFCHHQEEPHA